jgi:hypothetical protein
MKFSTIVYYYLIVPSFAGGIFKLVAWTLEKFQFVSLGEWAFTTGFIVSLLLFRPRKQWKTVTDPEFKYQVDFPGDPEKSLNDYDNGTRLQSLTFDLSDAAFVLQTIKTPLGTTQPTDEVMVQKETESVNGRLADTTQYQNGSIAGKCYCIAFERDSVNYLTHLVIAQSGQIQYLLMIASKEDDKSGRQEYYKKFFDTFVALDK